MLIADSVYYPTRRFAARVLKRIGVNVEYYDPLIGEGIAALLRPEIRLVLTELPGSQTFEVQDIPAICKAARAKGVPVAIDNTWGTPLYFPAFDYGVNISIQSCTKYIVGHADALLGAIICDEPAAAAVASTHEAYGLCANGEDCFLALRGLRTLGVRMERHWQSGLAIAAWLRARPEVGQVLHPALPGSTWPRALETRLQRRGGPFLDHPEALPERGRPTPAERARNLRHGLFLGRVRKPYRALRRCGGAHGHGLEARRPHAPSAHRLGGGGRSEARPRTRFHRARRRRRLSGF